MDATTTILDPHARATGSGSDGFNDRISVRDYTREVEIGAFSSERGVTQRVRFNVVLEVARGMGGDDDDVDTVLSYDTIVEAIEGELARERLNLLETLAERVAQRCLSDQRAVRAFVRVEKLDRVPGALGVEIVRSRGEGRPEPRPATLPPLVLFLPNAVLNGAEGARWRDAAARLSRPAILVLEPVSPQPPATGAAALRAGLLSIDQNAWALAAIDSRFAVAASRTEIDWALATGHPVVWAPARLAADAVDPERPDASAPLDLAHWLGATIEAERILTVGEGATSAGITVLDPHAPERLTDFA